MFEIPGDAASLSDQTIIEVREHRRAPESHPDEVGDAEGHVQHGRHHQVDKLEPFVPPKGRRASASARRLLLARLQGWVHGHPRLQGKLEVGVNVCLKRLLHGGNVGRRFWNERQRRGGSRSTRPLSGCLVAQTEEIEDQVKEEDREEAAGAVEEVDIEGLRVG